MLNLRAYLNEKHLYEKENQGKYSQKINNGIFFFFSNLSTWPEIIVKRTVMQEGHTCMMQVRNFQKDMFFFSFFFSSSLILVETSDLTLTGKETLDGKVYS